MTLCRGDAPLRFRQARPAHRAGIGRRRRAGEGQRVQGVHRLGRTMPTAASPRCACRAAPALSRKQIDDYAAHAAKYGAKGLAWMKVEDARTAAKASIRPSPSSSTTPHSPRSDQGHRRCRTATWCSSARQHTSTVCDFMGALRLKVGKDLGLVARRLGAAVGHRLPDVRVGRGGAALRRPASSVHRARGRRRGRPAREREDRGVARLRHGAQRQRDRRRFDPHPSPGHAERGVRAARHRRGGGRSASSASCSTRCGTARRRTAASPSASTASPR